MGRLSLSDRQERHSLYVLYSIVGDPIYVSVYCHGILVNWPYFSIVETVQIQLHLKGTWNIPESYIPSLGTSCENMALKNACIDFVWGSTCPKISSGAIVMLVAGIGSGLSKQTNWALMKLGIPQLPHYPIGVKRVHVSSPNVEGTVFQTFLNYNSVQATFLYSIKGNIHPISLAGND